ncbi:uncharacterized protein LOC142759896 [Rhinoderma darwinii]|uniref:uncharacterized protein LOC142759896 n=1 Tax=Rhinoderma darwinii TaxID=43563 RepID=UPI003F6809B9
MGGGHKRTAPAGVGYTDSLRSRTSLTVKTRFNSYCDQELSEKGKSSDRRFTKPPCVYTQKLRFLRDVMDVGQTIWRSQGNTLMRLNWTLGLRKLDLQPILFPCLAIWKKSPPPRALLQRCTSLPIPVCLLCRVLLKSLPPTVIHRSYSKQWRFFTTGQGGQLHQGHSPPPKRASVFRQSESPIPLFSQDRSFTCTYSCTNPILFQGSLPWVLLSSVPKTG